MIRLTLTVVSFWGRSVGPVPLPGATRFCAFMRCDTIAIRSSAVKAKYRSDNTHQARSTDYSVGRGAEMHLSQSTVAGMCTVEDPLQFVF